GAGLGGAAVVGHGVGRDAAGAGLEIALDGEVVAVALDGAAAAGHRAIPVLGPAEVVLVGDPDEAAEHGAVNRLQGVPEGRVELQSSVGRHRTSSGWRAQ